MFVHQLRMSIAPQQYTEIIKPSDNPLKFDPVYEKNCYRRFVFSYLIEKHVLKVILFFSHYLYPSLPEDSLFRRFRISFPPVAPGQAADVPS